MTSGSSLRSSEFSDFTGSLARPCYFLRSKDETYCVEGRRGEGRGEASVGQRGKEAKMVVGNLARNFYIESSGWVGMNYDLKD